jgi:hypothetical protein
VEKRFVQASLSYALDIAMNVFNDNSNQTATCGSSARKTLRSDRRRAVKRSFVESPVNQSNILGML